MTEETAGTTTRAAPDQVSTPPARRVRSPRQWIVEEFIKLLTKPLNRYELHADFDLVRLKRAIRKGDVVLVEGGERISLVIKYLTQSSWSHSAIYVGDEFLRRYPERRAELEEKYGEEASHLVLEALMEGVVFSPLSKYVGYNLRVCRPHGLRKDDLAKMYDELFGRVGHTYDIKNILDLARYFFPVSLIPPRFRREALALGSGKPTEVICSSMIAEAFHHVGFPVMPKVLSDARPQKSTWRDRLARKRSLGRYLRRPPTLITPREYDLSPFFEIIKFNFIDGAHFDYRQIVWVDDEHVKVPDSEEPS